MSDVMNQSDQNQQASVGSTRAKVQASLKKRYSAEKRFQLFGIASVGFGMLCLVILFTDIIGKGHGAFLQAEMQLTVNFDSDTLDISDITDEQQLMSANYMGLLKKTLRKRFPDVSGRKNKKRLYQLISDGAEYQLRDMLKANPQWLGTTQTIWVWADDSVDTVMKGKLGRDIPEAERPLNNMQLDWLDEMTAKGELRKSFNTNFFSNGASRNPEEAGIKGAVVGSLLTLMVTLALSFPIGVAAAIYLEEFAPKNKFTDIIEVNINNLAAVPSIIFGLLGLAIFLNFFEMPRSAPLVGGLVLTLMTLPTIIISSRAAIKAVPPSIREAALGIGASKMQMVMHHVLPLAMPGMLTGTIIGMAQALGETAPLLMIGMVAFIVDIPGGVTDPATVLPVQIFLWADSPERAFVERTSAAIMILVGVLITMNTIAVVLRKRLERRW
ncbi:MAG: phosphate ABC transporter permease PstA [Cellvibrionaceae bacterium]